MLGLHTYYVINHPDFYIQAIHYTDNKDPNTRTIYIKRIVAMGPRAIDPVIEQIKSGGTRSRGTWQFNNALKGLGSAAHQRLLKAADAETDNWKFMHLSDSLIEAFGDFSRAPRYLEEILKGKRSSYASSFRKQLMYKFDEDVPEIQAAYGSGQPSPKFVTWYQSKQTPHGDLPPWQP